MIVFWGSRDYGTVEECDAAAGRCAIKTRFAHMQFLPLVPLRSYVVTAEGALPIPLHLGSVAAAYLRTWGLGAALLVSYGVLVASGPAALWGLGQAGVAAALFVAVALWTAAAFGVGRLSATEQRQRQVYAEFLGMPVDARRLYSARGSGDAALRQRLRSEVVERAQGLAAAGYREVVDASSRWDRIALQQDVKDGRFLRAALTLARIEEVFATGPRRRELRDSHAALWRKLQADQQGSE